MNIILRRLQAVLVALSYQDGAAGKPPRVEPTAFFKRQLMFRNFYR
jgi:hypothetical protein